MWRRRLLSAPLAVALALAALPDVSWAQARPDLVLTGGDFNSPDNRRVITFTVKNVGTAPSSATAMVRVITSEPEPTPHFREIPLPPKTGLLKPGESAVLQPGEEAKIIYSLAAECNGHVVKALVYDPLDLNTANNSVENRVCLPAPPPFEDPIVVGPAPRQVPVPEHWRPGPHRLRLDPSHISSYFMDQFLESGSCGPYPAFYGRPGFHPVGWFQREDNREVLGIEFRECAYVGEGQAAVTFDYSLLDEVPDKENISARLRYRERELEWSDNGGQPGCVTALGFATVDWTLPNVSYVPIPTSRYRSSQLSQPYWNVDLIDERPRYGFVLRGALRLDQLEAQGSSSCLSVLDDIHLDITYVVPN